MKYIGIIVATEEELESTEKLIENKQIEQIKDIRFIKGKIQNKNVILLQCGVGKVNAARATQKLIDNFNISFIMNVGVAGAINVLLEIGDVIIAKSLYQHDFDITAFGHSKGYITGIGDCVYCDTGLINECEQMIKSMPERNYTIKFGIVATGDIFCTETWMKEKINGKFNADIVDMESAAIAQVCYLENIPFIAIRSISDIPNGNNAITYEENLKIATKRCNNILKEFFKYSSEL